MMKKLIIQQILVPFVLTGLKIVITVYTWLSIPLYYVLQRPWQRLAVARNCGAQLIAEGQLSKVAPEAIVGTPFKEYQREVEVPYHPLMDCTTLTEAFEKIQKLYPLDQPCFGHREILDEEVQYDHCGNPIRIDGKVLRKYKLSNYRWITLAETVEMVNDAGRGFVAAGMKENDKVAIFAETGINFTTSFLGVGSFGGIVVTLFHTLNNEGLVHAINETKPKFIVTSFELLDRVSSFIEQCPSIKFIVYFEGPKNKNLQFEHPTHINVVTYSKLREMGRAKEVASLTSKSLPPERVFMIMYTSGTTGLPKGVVATQAQIKEAAMACAQVVRDVMMDGPKHIYIAYLPQAHILELAVEMFLFVGGVRIGFASSQTLNESAPGLAKGQICDLQLLKPTVMTCVPLVLDRMQKEIYLKLSRRTAFSRDIFDYLTSYKSHWVNKGYTTPIVDLLLCGKVQEQFGGKLQYLIVGGAPLAPELQRLIKCSLNTVLIQGYGTTETCGGIMCMDFKDLSFGRAGSPMNGVRIRLVDWTEGNYSVHDKPNPRGEILVGGKMISQGYFEIEKLTRDSFFDDDGYHWFVTGDIGEVFPDGTFKIIDRKKDLVKLANGEFISLGKVEAVLKSSRYVDNVCIVANGVVNCLVALVVPNRHSIYELAISKFDYIDNSSMVDICQNRAIIKEVHQDICRVGLAQKLKRIELPSMIQLCHHEWTPENNLLTAAMKLKRTNLLKNYSHDLTRMFEEYAANPIRITLKS